MGWFRSHGRCGTWCALFALAVQLILSYGHVHVEGVVQTSGPLWSFINSPQSLSSDAADIPAAPRKHVAFGHYCAICATSVHSAGFLPAPMPVLAPLAIISDELIVSLTQTKLTASSSVHFRARAPPVA